MQRCRYILPAIWCHNRNQPVLILYESLNFKVVAQPKVSLETKIILAGAVRDEVRRHPGIPIADLHRVFRCEPICAPGLNSPAFPSNPASDNVVLIGVKIVIEEIVINKVPIYA